jgi:hypothetical protein
MENEIEKSTNEMPKILESIVEVASKVGEKLGEKLSDFIDDCFGVNKKNKI